MPEQAGAAFQQYQLQFTAHIRDPERNAMPAGASPRRMGIYVELMFNNISGQLASNFPVIRQLHTDARWDALVRDFMIRHQCQTPHFPEIALEFIAYLQTERDASGDYPFLLELAHYEYAELAVDISQDEEPPAHDPNGDLLSAPIVLANTAWNLSYQWPVHEIGPEFLPEQPPAEPTHLLVYRDRQDAVHFMEITAPTQWLIQHLKENPQATGQQTLTALAQQMQHPEPDAMLRFGAGILADLRERNVILGTVP